MFVGRKLIRVEVLTLFMGLAFTLAALGLSACGASDDDLSNAGRGPSHSSTVGGSTSDFATVSSASAEYPQCLLPEPDGLFDRLTLDGASPSSLSKKIQVIPYQALAQALENSGEDFEPPEAPSPEYESTVIMSHEDDSIGLTATFQEADAFEGELFIAPVDARFRQGTPLVEFTRYYIIEGYLAGETPWVGKDVDLWKLPVTGIASRCCDNPCGGYGKPGESSGGDPLCDAGGDGGQPCGPDMSCERFEFDQLFSDVGALVDFNNLSSCEHCKRMDYSQMSCAVDDYDLGSAGWGTRGQPTGGAGCSTALTSGAPSFCHIIYPEDPTSIPAACGRGYYDPRLHHLWQGQGILCESPTRGAGPSVNSSGSLAQPHHPGVAPNCGAPLICQQIQPAPGSDAESMCSGKDDFLGQNRTQMWMEAVGCGPDQTGGASGIECCGEYCVCMTSGDGLEKMCEQCNADGDCTAYAMNTFGDPRVMGDSDEDDANAGGDEVDDEEESCAENVTCMEQMVFDSPVTVMEPMVITSSLDQAHAQAQASQSPASQKKGDDGTPNSADAAGARPDAMNIQGPDPVAANSNQGGGSSKGGGKPDETSAADPVLLKDGSLDIRQIDLSFPAPMRGLHFARSYNSQDENRGALGSNWTHNFEVYLEFIRPGNAPAWAAPYCTRYAPVATCLLYHDGTGSTHLFTYDAETAMYVPQAGSSARIRTIRATHPDSTSSCTKREMGWLLVQPNGAYRTFNQYGYMTADHDRFGNGVRVEYEPTPLFSLYSRYCSAPATEERDSTDCTASLGNYPDDSIAFDWGGDTRAPSELCLPLATVFGDAPMPSRFGGDFAQWSGNWASDAETRRLKREPAYSHPAGFASHRDWIEAARAYYDGLTSDWERYQFPAGGLRLRPRKVVDDLGRELVFQYDNTPVNSSGVANSSFGLLEQVSGPSSTSVEFSYERPPSHPDSLNETFLISAERESQQSVEGRMRYDFEYQWSSNLVPGKYGATGGRFGKQLDSFRNHVEDSQIAYLVSQMACYYEPPPESCDRTGYGNTNREGDPCAVAEMQAHRLLSAVADNIIRVKRNTRVEVETMFGFAPDRHDFDRALVQRFGGQEIQSPDFGFESGYPTFEFAYIGAGPVAKPRISGDLIELQDRTEGHNGAGLVLPSEIASRYPLETEPAEVDGNGDPTDYGLRKSDALASYDFEETDWDDIDFDEVCGENRDTSKFGNCVLDTVGAFTMLPGFQMVLPYYELQDEDKASARVHLKRSRLTCDQLATAQVANPLSNDILWQYSQDADGQYEVARFETYRQEIAENNNRICQWVQIIDRDSNVSWHGLNYRGQTLVEAVYEESLDGTGAWIFGERIYNADGNLIEDRVPVANVAATTIADAYTEYEYDERVPVNATELIEDRFFFIRRQNLLSTTQYAEGGAALVQSPANGGATTYLTNRRVEYDYEPAFNQVTRSVVSVQDWQEQSRTQLYETIYNWDHWDSTNDEVVVGGIGVPVSVTRRSLDFSAPDRVTSFTWTANGQIATRTSPQGEVATYFYYPSLRDSQASGFYGGTVPPSGSDMSSSYQGLLARLEVEQFDADYATTVDPATDTWLAGSPIASELGAPKNPSWGPYAWLGTDKDELQQLGLSTETIDFILDVKSNPKRAVDYSYDVTGRSRFVWTDSV